MFRDLRLNVEKLSFKAWKIKGNFAASNLAHKSYE